MKIAVVGINFARLYDRLGDARSKPCNLWTGDEEARQVVEQLNHLISCER